MSTTPREIGTLVVVILKAQHLPNKQRIGKQDPFCSVALNGERRRTRAIKRGGQHPEWDEEVRFTLFEDTEDMLARTASESSNSLGSNGEGGGKGTPPPPPPKESSTPTTAMKKRKKVKGGNSMLLACYADDPKEPELIGETAVDLTEVLTKGETDEWFTLSNKDKFAGEVYLELTFWSNERPPEKKNKSQLVKPNKQYGGPGSFVPSDSEGSFGTVDSRGSIPSSLRSTSSLAHLDLYNPPYERTIRSQGTGTTLDQIADEFGGLSVAPGPVGRRRESYPPPRTGHTPRPTDSAFSSVSSSHSYHSNGYASEGYDSGYDNPTTPILRGHRHSFGEPGQSFPVYQSPYESGAVHSSGFTSSRPRSVSTMYSVPSASSGFSSGTTPTPSGFAPGTTPTPSGFTQVPTGTPAPSGFMPPGAQAPVPTGYSPYPYPSQTPVQYGYGPPLTHTPAPSGFAPPPSAMGYHQPPAHIQPYAPYQQYPPPPPSNSAPPAVYQPGPGSTLPTPPGPPSTIPTPPHSAPPQQYPNAPSPSHSAMSSQHYPVYPPKTPSPPQQYSIPPPPVQVPGSRPLPTPGQKNGSHPGTPPHPSMLPAQQGVSPTHPGGQPAYFNTPPHMPIQQQQQQQPPQQLSHPLPTPPGPPSQPPMTAGPPPAVPQNGFVPPPPPPPLSRLPGPPPVLPVQVYHHQSASDPSIGRGGSPTTRPPLPQPPMGASNSGPLPPPGPPSFPSITSSGFQPPPPPPPLSARRSVSTPHHLLPQPLQGAPPMPQLPRSVKPGEIFNPGPPPRPPMQMVHDGSSAFWSAPPQMQ